MKRVGILTGGGDSPGLNAVIRAVVVRLAKEGVSTVGYLEGWKGVLEGRTRELSVNDVIEIVSEGGTMLGSSRTNPFKNPERDVPRILDSLKALELDALVAVGGDDTLGVAAKLYDAHKVDVVGVPKTIDNDLSGTDFTFGFDTAVQNATEAIDKLVTTTRSHRRVMVVEVMGRHAGWIAAYAGVASGADWVLIPERPIDVKAMCEGLRRARKRGDLYNIVVVAEGARLQEEVLQTQERDAFGHVRLGGIGPQLAKIIQDETGFESRHVVLGHLQRGGTPTAWDRVLSTRYGLGAAELVLRGEFGRMVALQGGKIVSVSLQEATGETKTLSPDFLAMAELFFS